MARVLVCCAWIAFCSPATSQEVASKLRVVDSLVVQALDLEGGSSLTGRILEIGADRIKFSTDLGVLDIEINKIAAYREIRGGRRVGHEFWFPNPNSSRLLLMPTARSLEQGQAYFQNIYIFFNGGAVGITNNLALGGGLSLFPDADEQLWYLAPKLGFKVSDNLHVAGGALWLGLTGGGETAGLAYGVSTVGSRDASLTFGVGYGFSGDEVANEPVFVVGGEKRLSRRVAVVSENWFVPAEDPLVSFGVRMFGEGIAVDFAFFRPTGFDWEGFPFIPYVDFLVYFR